MAAIRLLLAAFLHHSAARVASHSALGFRPRVPIMHSSVRTQPNQQPHLTLKHLRCMPGRASDTGRIPGSRSQMRFAVAEPTLHPKTSEKRVDDLLKLIERGREACDLPPAAPLTNLSLINIGENNLNGEIKSAVRLLEGARIYKAPVLMNKSALYDLNGPWRLIYSDAGEITRLYKLPAKVRPTSVYQRINIPRFTFENHAFLKGGPMGSLGGSIRVVSEFKPAPREAVNNIGKENVDGDRIDVNFLAVILSIKRLLFLPTPLRRVVKPRSSQRVQSRPGSGPSLDTTYLDGNVRVGRGGDGSVFVLVKDLHDPDGPLAESRVARLRPENKVYDPTKGSLITQATKQGAIQSFRPVEVTNENPNKAAKSGRLTRVWRWLRGRREKKSLKKLEDLGPVWGLFQKSCISNLRNALAENQRESILENIRLLAQYNPSLTPAKDKQLEGRWRQLFHSQPTGKDEGSEWKMNGSIRVPGNTLNPGGLTAGYDAYLKTVGDENLILRIPSVNYQVFSAPVFLRSKRTGEREEQSLSIDYLDQQLLLTRGENGSLVVFTREESDADVSQSASPVV
ncbi:hypothetical protein AAMO2058_001157600 [Amorphochlora amoebiformis]